MRIPVSLLLFFVSLIGFLTPGRTGAAGETIVVSENFDKPPNRWIAPCEGVRGNGGSFQGNGCCYLDVSRRCSRLEVELHFNSEDAASSGNEMKDWRPLVRTQIWKEGGIQFLLRKGRLCVMFHGVGKNRTILESPPIENNRWYKGKFVIDTENHTLALFLDDHRVAAGAIGETFDYLVVDSLAVGTVMHPSGYSYRGMMDEIKVVAKTIPERESDDPRNIVKGNIIPDELYCDQPYIVILDDGTWVCLLTTARGHEGQRGMHVVSTRSSDRGKTWSPLVEIEQVQGASTAWVVPLLTPYGRIYAFYNQNAERATIDVPQGTKSVGIRWYVYRYSDDGGLTWSKERFRIPIRRTKQDLVSREGKVVQQFWGMCKPRVEGNDVFLTLAKLGRNDEGEVVRYGVEGWIIHSGNILSERDPEKIRWETLPEGENPLRSPEFGPIQEEHNLVPLDRKDSFYCVYRTASGFCLGTYSRDRCRSWSVPEPMTYASGRVIRNPRACAAVWKAGSGRYLLWFHNNGSKGVDNRNPAWLAAGLERDGTIYWSQPEIVLYADEPTLGMSYPDLVVLDGRYWISETQKSIARVHSVDETLLEGAWNGLADELDRKPSRIVEAGLRSDTVRKKIPFPDSLKGALEQNGMTFDFTVDVPAEGIAPGTVLFGNRTSGDDGFVVTAIENGAYAFEVAGISGGKRKAIRWTSETEILLPGKHALTIVVEAAPRLIFSVADERFLDGNDLREFGWIRYENVPERFEGTGTISISPFVERLRLYDRPLRTYEALSNQRFERTTGAGR